MFLPREVLTKKSYQENILTKTLFLPRKCSYQENVLTKRMLLPRECSCFYQENVLSKGMLLPRKSVNTTVLLLFFLQLAVYTEPAEVSSLATVSISASKDTTGPKGVCVGVTGALDGEKEVESTEEEDGLVEAMADRLCAVTHAFALSCSTLQRNSRRQVLQMPPPSQHM